MNDEMNDNINHPTINKEEFMNLVIKENNGCWIWKQSCQEKRGGYGQKRIEGKIFTSHRLAWLIFNGEIPQGIFVCHKCDIPKCCNPDHLFLGTPKDNANDAWNKGRMPLPQNAPKGETHHSSKLKEKDIYVIRESIKNGVSLIFLSRQFGVSKQTIHKIKVRKTWKII